MKMESDNLREKENKKSAYFMELAAPNGLARREFFRLTLFLRLNDMRLKNWRKSKLRIVSMVDVLKNIEYEIDN